MMALRTSSVSSRRRLLQAAGCLAAAACLPARSPLAAPVPPASSRILKTLKIGMVKVNGSLEDKFRVVKEAGFDGLELNAPGIDVAATRAAIAQTGLVVDGTVCATHWKVRHSSPDADVRRQALQDLITGIEQTSAIGGHTLLLVVGHGDDGPESEIIPRSIENIAQALPTAAKHGIYIAIENVWNKFLYDHDGSADQSADRFAAYVDTFNSPWVGMQFDLGNHWQYGDPAQWIRTLGKRIVKLDIKGYSRAEGKFREITQGDIDWGSVRQALQEIGFHGWCAAEVKGGDSSELRRIATEIETALG
jgi:hexulose-6-phosphate isomerase